MKKLFVILFAVIGFAATAEAQNVVIQSNTTPSGQTQDPNVFYINGIPSTQDIGGVDTHPYWENCYPYVMFTNYHSYAVTVLYHIIDEKGYETTGSIVLIGGQNKSVRPINSSYSVTNVATITRKLE